MEYRSDEAQRVAAIPDPRDRHDASMVAIGIRLDELAVGAALVAEQHGQPQAQEFDGDEVVTELRAIAATAAHERAAGFRQLANSGVTYPRGPRP